MLSLITGVLEPEKLHTLAGPEGESGRAGSAPPTKFGIEVSSVVGARSSEGDGVSTLQIPRPLERALDSASKSYSKLVWD